MKRFLFKLISFPFFNYIIRNLLKPFSVYIPQRFHFAISGTFKINLEKGKSILLHCNSTSYLGRKLFWEGIKGYEYPSVRLFLELAKASRTFLDIGSNIGYYSLVAAAVNPKINVIGFEPMPAAFYYFKKNIEKNRFKSIKPENIALSDKKGKSKFFAVQNPDLPHIKDQLAGDGSINPDFGNNSIHKEIEITTDTLNNYIRGHKISGIDLIKLDTEASEHLVLSEGYDVLINDRPIIFCEVLKDLIEKELENILRRYNYLFFQVTPDGLSYCDSLSNNTTQYVDYIMVPSEKQELIQVYLKK